MKELSIGARLAWQIAGAEAKVAKHQYIEKGHIFIGICSLGIVNLHVVEAIPETQQQALKLEYRILKDIPSNLTQLRCMMHDSLPKGNYEHKEDDIVHRSEACKKEVFERADDLAVNTEEITCIHLLAAILERPGNIISKVLEEAKVNLLDLQKDVLDLASKKKEIQEEIGDKKEPIIGKLEELIDILKENIGKEQKIAHPLNPGKVSLPKRGYRAYIHEVISELEEIIAGLAEGLKFQAALAVVEGVFVLYYSLGIWHFIIPEEKWNEISARDKGIVGLLLAISVPFATHFYIHRKRWKFGVSLAVFVTAVIYAFIVTFRV